MTIYNISYDLTKPGRDYENLRVEIEKLGLWVRPVKSTWLVETEVSLPDVRSRLVAIMDSDDKLIITTCSKGTAWKDLHPDVISWIKQRL